MKELESRSAALTGGNAAERVEQLEWAVDRWTREVKRAVDTTRRAGQHDDGQRERPEEDGSTL